MNGERLAVVVLAEHIYGGYRVWEAIRELTQIDCTIFLCNNRWGKLKYLAANAYLCARRLGLRGSLRLLGDVTARRVRLRLSLRPLQENLGLLRELAADVGLHAMDVIYRQEAIDCFRLGILNPHIGKLPQFRGRSVMEWSILYGEETGVTTFFIDAGIDTGAAILSFRPVPVAGYGEVERAKQHLFAQNAVCFRDALATLSAGNATYLKNDVEGGRRFYVMSQLFHEVVSEVLQVETKKGPSAGPAREARDS